MSRAWFVDRYGGPERLLLRERGDLAPGPGEVVIRVAAIGLNFADLFVRAGVYPRTPKPPFVPGMEVSGVVVAVGAGAGDFAAGQHVVAIPLFGGHAEEVVCPHERVFALPAGADLVEAAAMAVTFLTAHYAIAAARIESGERVVITAAAGGVGTALLQLLAQRADFIEVENRQVRTLALASSSQKLEICRTLGATHAATYAEGEALIDAQFAGRADVVIDAIGGATFRRLWRCLDRGGRYVLYGFAAASGRRGVARLQALREFAAMGFLAPYSFVSSCRTLIGFNLSLLPAKNAALRRAAAETFAAWSAGRISPVIGERFEFERLPEAHRALAGRNTTGKVLVVVRPVDDPSTSSG